MTNKNIPAKLFFLITSLATAFLPANAQTLKDAYKNYFSIGVAVSANALKAEEADLVKTQFNSLTPENAMKIGPIHPKESLYNFKDADSIAAFARKNHFKMRGHTLVWHNQTPDWLFKDEKGNKVTKDVLLSRMKKHIDTVVGRYKGTVYAWDVVNEAISDKKDEYLRPSPWLEIIGEEYIAKAFEYAHEADPQALLFYNDYNEINESKRTKIMKLITDLRTKGVPIHGIGLQGHWAINEPSKDQLEKTLSDFSKTGLHLQITELDISVYPKEHQARERKADDSDTSFNDIRKKKQEEMYQMCFELFRKYKDQISSVTFWNISDKHSWLDNFPVKNRKDYPLLFDSNLQPKTSFYKVVQF